MSALIWMDVDAALAEVPVNAFPLLDDGDFKTREASVAYNASGMDLVWNFVTPGGSFTQTAVTPSNSGSYLWTNQGKGFYTLQIPASGGASINNDTEGFGWFTGVATGVLPWVGPVIGFRAAALNNLLIESAFSTTRGLAGTAVPDAAAGAAGGLPISTTGLDTDDLPANISADLLPQLAEPEELAAAVGALAGADPTAVPGPTATLIQKIDFLLALARNKITQTSTTQTLRNAADDGSIGTATVSDNGTTFTRNSFT